MATNFQTSSSALRWRVPRSSSPRSCSRRASNLDAKLRVEMRTEVRRTSSSRRRASTVYVRTPRQSEPWPSPAGSLFMKRGVIDQVGDHACRLLSPVDEFVADCCESNFAAV